MKLLIADEWNNQNNKLPHPKENNPQRKTQKHGFSLVCGKKFMNDLFNWLTLSTASKRMKVPTTSCLKKKNLSMQEVTDNLFYFHQKKRERN